MNIKAFCKALVRVVVHTMKEIPHTDELIAEFVLFWHHYTLRFSMF